MSKKKVISLISAILCLMLFVGLCSDIRPVQVGAASSAEIKQELDKLEERNDEIEEELSQLRGQLSDNLDEMSALIAQKDLVDKEIALLYEQMDNINSQIIA